MTTTTNYGSWYNVQGHELTAAATVAAVAGDAHDDYDLDAVESDYLTAIQEALPPGVYVNGLEFIGPYYDDDKHFDGYPADEDGDLDLTAIVESVDIMEILERHELVDIDEATWRLGYGSAASTRKALARWGVAAAETRPHPESNRPQHRYNWAEVKEARAARPGRGARTDRIAQGG